MSRFPLIVIPECDTLSSSFIDGLLDYARQGGSLLIVGEKMSRCFSKAAGLEQQGDEWFSRVFGKGRIGFIPNEIASDYEAGRHAEDIRSRVRAIVGELFPAPLVTVRSSPYVDVSVRKHDGKLQVHLVNTSGDHRNTPILDSIPPVKSIEVSIRLSEKPSRIVLQPEGKTIHFKYKGGMATCRIPSLEIYDILEIEP